MMDEKKHSSDNRSVERPENIGPYRILDTLGEGGMSIVYLAEQSEPVKRRVALKILKPGMDSKQVVARFESERQALAVLDHPKFAKIFDGGRVAFHSTAIDQWNAVARRKSQHARRCSFAMLVNTRVLQGMLADTCDATGEAEMLVGSYTPEEIVSTIIRVWGMFLLFDVFIVERRSGCS